MEPETTKQATFFPELKGDRNRTVAVLPPELANQIAAGEVVERPSSVVKELIENSLDANAKRLEVRIENGGQDRITVIDDGHGMLRDDALRALERHATSKISSVNDLFSIATLGFRGEAIPSIGSVSKMTIRTQRPEDLVGTELLVEGGILQHVKDTGIAAGTEIDIQDLFFNTPARRKFLKTSATESRHITSVLTRTALARPDVRIKLQRDGKTHLDLAAASSLKDRILSVLGREVFDDLYPTFDYPDVNGVVARGYFSRPGHVQRSPRNIYTFVNGRYVSDSTIRAAIKGAYGTMLDKGKHPSVVLFLSVPFDLVDINVHPAKTEVRFNDTGSIYRAVFHAIADELARAPWLSGVSKTFFLRSPEKADAPSAHRDEWILAAASLSERNENPVPGFGQRVFEARGAAPLPEPPRLESETGIETEGFYFANLKVIGQFKRQYIVCEDKNAMVVIDQHAAHERLRFEQLKEMYESAQKKCQPLLFPARIELDAIRAQTLDEHLSFFWDAGFEIEPFGGTTFVLKAAPAFLPSKNHAQMIKDAVDDFESFGQTTRVDEAIHSVLSRLACHSAVRGPTELNDLECKHLLEEMDKIDFRGNCPHGRPVYFRIPLEEMELRFDRR